MDGPESAASALSSKNHYDIIYSECAFSLARDKNKLAERIYAALTDEGKLVVLDMRESETEHALFAAGFEKIYEDDMSEELLRWAGQIIFEHGSLAAYFESVTPEGEDMAAYCGAFACEGSSACGYAMSIFARGR
jgi:uncharacterized protein YihD (DUF1040 family)